MASLSLFKSVLTLLISLPIYRPKLLLAQTCLNFNSPVLKWQVYLKHTSWQNELVLHYLYRSGFNTAGILLINARHYFSYFPEYRHSYILYSHLVWSILHSHHAKFQEKKVTNFPPLMPCFNTWLHFLIL